MPGHYQRRIEAILNAPIRLPDDNVARVKKPPGVRDGYTISLDLETERWLARIAPVRYRIVWINAQANANYLVSHWVDTRPEELREADRVRLESGTLPLWTEGSTMSHTCTKLNLSAQAVEILCAVSDAYGIGPQQYSAYRLFEGVRSYRLDTELSTNQKLSAVIRAWAGGYITPRFTVQINTEPTRKRYGKRKK